MASFSSHEAAQAPQLLSSSAIDRRNDLEQFETECPGDSGDDKGTDAPIFDQFYDQGGAKSIVEMTNSNAAQFIGILAGFESLILENYKVWRGHKCAHKPEVVLLMVLAVLKHGGTWDFLARMFSQKTSAFVRMVLRFIQL